MAGGYTKKADLLLAILEHMYITEASLKCLWKGIDSPLDPKGKNQGPDRALFYKRRELSAIREGRIEAGVAVGLIVVSITIVNALVAATQRPYEFMTIPIRWNSGLKELWPLRP